MLWTTLRWNFGNTLPFAAFCLLSIIAIGEGWRTASADASPLPAVQTSTIAAFPADLRQPAAASALSTD
jgi:hypothetical protein